MTINADILGWIGNIFFIGGMILIAKQNRNGFIFNIIGNFLYILQSIKLNVLSLFFISFILIFVNIYGLNKWK